MRVCAYAITTVCTVTLCSLWINSMQPLRGYSIFWRNFGYVNPGKRSTVWYCPQSSPPNPPYLGQASQPSTVPCLTVQGCTGVPSIPVQAVLSHWCLLGHSSCMNTAAAPNLKFIRVHGPEYRQYAKEIIWISLLLFKVKSNSAFFFFFFYNMLYLPPLCK